MTPIETIVSLVIDTNMIMFDDAVRIKLSPHTWPINIYGVQIVNSCVWLLNSDGDWHKLEATDRNFQPVANSIIQRLKSIARIKMKCPICNSNSFDGHDCNDCSFDADNEIN